MLQAVPAQANSAWEVLSCEDEDDALRLLGKARSAALRFDHHDEVLVLPYDPHCPCASSDQAMELLCKSRVGRVDQGHNWDPEQSPNLVLRLYADSSTSDGQSLHFVKDLVMGWQPDDENQSMGFWQPRSGRKFFSLAGEECNNCLV